MKTSQKIGLIVTSIVILGSIFFISWQSQHTISFQSENELDDISTDTYAITFSSFDSPLIGFSDAPVRIFAFNDYQCMSCKTWYENEFPEILKTMIETKKVNIIFLDSIPLGADSVLISQAAFCADDQEKYLEYQTMLFSSQQKIDEWAKYEQLKKFAIDLDLDGDLFEKCLDSRKYENKILSNIDKAKNLGISKIPLFKIVNYDGKEFILKGGLSSEMFENIVDQFQ